MRICAEQQWNWAPSTLGPMSLRPGWGMKGRTRSDLTARPLPFVFSPTDTAILELTDQILRIWLVDDAADTETLVSRAAVSTAVTNGDFSSDTGWTLTETGS